MPDLDTREWLLTNGLGSFASGTISDVRTRTYHGWLFAATNPPCGRTLLFSHMEASLEVSGRVIPLGTNCWGNHEIAPQGYKLLHYFDINPVPQWIWRQDNWQLSRELIMPHGFGDICKHQLLIKYHYHGKTSVKLRLRLLIGDRDFHHQQKGHPGLEFSQLLGENQVCLQAIFPGGFGTPWYLRWSRGEYQANKVWYWDYLLPEEKKRGLGDREDLYSPGHLTVKLEPGDAIVLEAQMGFPDPQQALLTPEIFTAAVEAEQKRLSQIFGWVAHKSPSSPIWQKLLKASDQFIVHRASIAGPTVIAGYHWFNDWGRDTLIAIPGLTLVTRRFELAKGLLQTFGRYCRHGLIPNVFPDVDGQPSYNSIDAALWWIETLGLYLEATQDWEFLAVQFPIVQQIHKAFMGGTHYNIQVDATDGLVSWDVPGMALTWMDVVIDGVPVTPRNGKAVEINALWYSALCWMSKWAQRLSEMQLGDSTRLVKQAWRYSQQAEQVKISLQKFWNPLGYLYDTIELDDRRNAQIRPNAVIALSLHHCGFSPQQSQAVVDLATVRLLTPYGLRSLDTSDPAYIGKYIGNSPERDRSYHQGTVWAWLIGPFTRAWERSYPQLPLPFDWQPLLDHFLCDACIQSISEIFDGDFPHTPKGAIAQAWSVAEVIRHFPPGWYNTTR
ncbi:amylo-alpha-1,6-glucosidase [Anabaenopsis elenkinii]|uniref:Glycogen debranching enzyme family protein n=1 Tax=Anabaenopsis elenkinii CCIBt3563 TaxID=2779889 RepID=A0A7S6RET5_9CYAN|nr:amylo-alpha-1,6-glucosidase [Anabaenopsis elenkinii]QOV23588.1 glycogen debranching enzyme family protein [Anabaenopsis elenkinii CCIBt3563]